MPNPTTNPTRLSRTAREVAWNPLPGDAIRLPGGDFKTMSSAPNARERFLKALAQAPAGSTIRPYDGLGFYTGAYITRTLISRDLPMLRRGVYLPEILDRWMCSGDGRKSEALTALDFTANLPEAPFVHHAANILHCMVKFGAPAFVAAKPARDPRNNPQPGDVRIAGHGLRWEWGRGHGPISLDFWRKQNPDGDVRWECGEPPAPAEKPGPYSWMSAFQDHYPGTARPFNLPNYFAKYGPWPVVSGPPEGRPFGQNVHVGGVVDLGRLNHIIAECAAALRSDGDAHRCPRTDPRPGDICILTNDEVEVFTDGTSKAVWRIGGPRIRWVRAEDVVRG